MLLGRQLSGIVLENWMLGRKKHIWLSISADLHIDARRDLDDIDAGFIQQCPLRSLSYKKIDFDEGIIFATYSSLISSSRPDNGKQRRRIDQLIQWCGEDFDGCILFDECHKAKNLYPANGQAPTKTGLAVKELQDSLPNARIIYSSATGVTEPSNMAFMERLGLWGQGSRNFNRGFQDFVEATRSCGLGLMELVAMHLKRQGHFLCRTLSFAGCEFKVEEDSVSEQEFKRYDAAAEMLMQLYKDLETGLAEGMLDWYPMKSAVDEFDMQMSDYEDEEEDDSDIDEKERPLKIPPKNAFQFLMRYFWSKYLGCSLGYLSLIMSFIDEHQRFFRSLCISLKVPHAVKLAKASLAEGKAVVIGLQSTGESAAEAEASQAAKNLSKMHDFISSPAAGLKRLIYKLFPLPVSASALSAKVNSQLKKQPMQKRRAAVVAKQRINSRTRSYEEDSDEEDSADDSGSDLGSFIASDDSDEELSNSGGESVDYREQSSKSKFVVKLAAKVASIDDDELVEGEIEELVFDDAIIVDLTRDSDSDVHEEENIPANIPSDDESRLS
jgi:hypothetical protein